jgi:quercetin dioxygenase-like cupin family protein
MKPYPMKINLLTLTLLLFSAKLFAQPMSVLEGGYVESNAIQVCKDNLVWTDAKPPLPPGAKVAVLEGNPKEAGHFTMRLKLPAHYKVPPHSHPVDERVTVISGSIHIGAGDKMDIANAKKMYAGCFYLNPAGLVHYAYTGKEETILQISTNGPWGATYVEEKK